MNQFKLFFTICNQAIFDLVGTNTPECRQAFIEQLRQYNHGLILDLERQIQEQALRNSTKQHLETELKRLKARQYFIDKHEDMFIQFGYTNMNHMATYNLKVAPL